MKKLWYQSYRLGSDGFLLAKHFIILLKNIIFNFHLWLKQLSLIEQTLHQVMGSMEKWFSIETFLNSSKIRQKQYLLWHIQWKLWSVMSERKIENWESMAATHWQHNYVIIQTMSSHVTGSGKISLQCLMFWVCSVSCERFLLKWTLNSKLFYSKCNI